MKRELDYLARADYILQESGVRGLREEEYL